MAVAKVLVHYNPNRPRRNWIVPTQFPYGVAYAYTAIPFFCFSLHSIYAECIRHPVYLDAMPCRWQIQAFHCWCWANGLAIIVKQINKWGVKAVISFIKFIIYFEITESLVFRLIRIRKSVWYAKEQMIYAVWFLRGQFGVE